MSKTLFTSTFALVAILALGCQDSQDYETQKPVVDEPAAADGQAIPEVDIDSPAADVEVGTNPETGGVTIDVDAPSDQVEADVATDVEASPATTEETTQP